MFLKKCIWCKELKDSKEFKLHHNAPKYDRNYWCRACLVKHPHSPGLRSKSSLTAGPVKILVSNGKKVV